MEMKKQRPTALNSSGEFNVNRSKRGATAKHENA
jgi:hypothetical protein